MISKRETVPAMRLPRSHGTNFPVVITSCQGLLLSLLLTITIMTAGCTGNTDITGSRSNANSNVYPAIYQSLNTEYAGREDGGKSPADPGSGNHPQLAEFIELFRNLKRDDVADMVHRVYAETLYFNDTLKTVLDRDTLAGYLEETAGRVDFNHVEVEQVLFDGDSYFLRWSMTTGFSVMGRSVESLSIGMTHLRLDDQGKVVLHQDFWDNTEGLFRHLPVVGSLIEKIRNRF
jgi:hypothetical protein